MVCRWILRRTRTCSLTCPMADNHQKVKQSWTQLLTFVIHDHACLCKKSLKKTSNLIIRIKHIINYWNFNFHKCFVFVYWINCNKWTEKLIPKVETPRKTGKRRWRRKRKDKGVEVTNHLFFVFPTKKKLMTRGRYFSVFHFLKVIKHGGCLDQDR